MLAWLLSDTPTDSSSPALPSLPLSPWKWLESDPITIAKFLQLCFQANNYAFKPTTSAQPGLPLSCVRNKCHEKIWTRGSFAPKILQCSNFRAVVMIIFWNQLNAILRLCIYVCLVLAGVGESTNGEYFVSTNIIASSLQVLCSSKSWLGCYEAKNSDEFGNLPPQRRHLRLRR